MPADKLLGLIKPQSSIYPGVPPEIDKFAVPSENPLQLGFVVFSMTEI